MTFVTDKEVLKPGLIIFRRADVQHRNWYCRVKLPKADRYKTVSLKTSNMAEARDLAFEQESELRYRIKLGVPIFNRPFSEIAKGGATMDNLRGRYWQPGLKVIKDTAMDAASIASEIATERGLPATQIEATEAVAIATVVGRLQQRTT